MSRRLARLWGPAVLVLFPLLVYWPATSGRVLLGPGDGVMMFLPLRVFAAEAWRHGALPLWNQWVFSGFPLLAAMTAGVFSPLTLLYVVASPLTAMTWSALATLAACGLTTCAYARAVGCTRAGAVFAGLTFAGSGFVVARLGNVPVLHAVPWLPLLLFALERLRAEARLRWVATAALAVALAVFAGHPQVPAYTLGVAVAYAVARAATAEPRQRARYLLLAAAGLGGGLLLATPQLLPTAELGRQSVRDRLPFASFVEFALTPAQLRTLFLPLFDASGSDPAGVAYNAPLEQAGYTGLAALALAVAALGAGRRSAVVAFWAVVAALSLLMVLGEATPLARLAYHLPVYNLFRICARNFFQFDLAVAVLAGIGLSRVQRGVGARALLVAAAVVAAATAVLAVPALAGGAVPPAVAIVPLVLVGLVLLAALAAARRPSAGAVALLLALQGTDLWLYTLGLQQSLPTTATALVAPDWLPAMREVAGDGRAVIAAAGGVAPTDYRQALHGQRLIQGYDSLLIRRYSVFAGDMDYAGRIADAELVGAPLFLDLLGVRAAVVPFPERLDPAVAAGGATFAYQQLQISLAPGDLAEFALPVARPVRAVAAETFLGGAVGVGQGEAAAEITVVDAAGGGHPLVLAAGEHTAEWAWDRADVRTAVRHRRAPVAETFDMSGTPANQYVGVVALPAPVDAVRVRVRNVLPSSTLQLSRLSLLAPDGTVTPLSLLHLLLDRPQRWARRASLRVEEPMQTARAVLGADAVRARLRLPAPSALHDTYGVEVFENQRALPAAWLVPRTLAADGWGALSSVRTGRLPDGTPFDPRAVALVEDAPGRVFAPPDPAATAEVVARAPQRLEIATRSGTEGFLVVSEIDYPGWTATVDGAPASILRTNGVLRGLAVPAGEHRVVFAFRPLSVRLGLGLAAATLLAFAAAALWRARRRRRGRGAQPRHSR